MSGGSGGLGGAAGNTLSRLAGITGTATAGTLAAGAGANTTGAGMPFTAGFRDGVVAVVAAVGAATFGGVCGARGFVAGICFGLEAHPIASDPARKAIATLRPCGMCESPGEPCRRVPATGSGPMRGF
jgi:hypothetical protein